MKKIFCFSLFILILLGLFIQSPANAAYEIRDSQVYINGKYVGNAALEILNGRAFVALTLFKEFGFAISWDNQNQIAVIEDTVMAGDEQFSTKHYWWAIMVNNYTLVENNPSKTKWTIAYMDELGYPDPPLMAADKVFVPLRLFMQIMGGDVDYAQGDINFNLPKNVMDDIDYRVQHNTVVGEPFTANKDLLDVFLQEYNE